MNLLPGKKDIAALPQVLRGPKVLMEFQKIWHRDPTRSILDTSGFTTAQAQSGPISEWGGGEDQG